MSSSRRRLRVRSLVTASMLPLAIATGGCSHGQNAEPQSAPDRQPPANANILERHEMNPSASSFLELIQGRLPGVLVRQRGSSISVEIRGQSSFRSSNEALILIDGIENSTRSLTAINPADVERVEVVKDGAAAIYGVRGANGVLSITTRRR